MRELPPILGAILAFSSCIAAVAPVVRVWSPETRLVRACCHFGATSSWTGDAFECKSGTTLVFHAKRQGEFVSLDAPPQMTADVIVLLAGTSDLSFPSSSSDAGCDAVEPNPADRGTRAFHDLESAERALEHLERVLTQSVGLLLKQLERIVGECGNESAGPCSSLKRELPWRREEAASAGNEVRALRSEFSRKRATASSGTEKEESQVSALQERIRILLEQLHLLNAQVPYSD